MVASYSVFADCVFMWLRVTVFFADCVFVCVVASYSVFVDCVFVW